MIVSSETLTPSPMVLEVDANVKRPRTPMLQLLSTHQSYPMPPPRVNPLAALLAVTTIGAITVAGTSLTALYVYASSAAAAAF